MDWRMWAARPMAGAVLRCAGSARICCARHLGQLADDFVAQMIVGENPDALGRNHRAQAVDGLLDQRALAEEAQNLFGAAAPAARPEARASASRQDQAVAARVAPHQPSGYP